MSINKKYRLPCMIIRGGTSKGLYFLEKDLPKQQEERDAVLMKVMGNFFEEKNNMHLQKGKFFVFALFIFCSSHVLSQTASDSILKEPTLSNIIQYALKNQPAVQQTLMNEAITQLQIKSK